MNYIKIAENFPLRQFTENSTMKIYSSSSKKQELRTTLLQRSTNTPTTKQTFSKLYSQQLTRQTHTTAKTQLLLDDLLSASSISLRPKSSGKNSLKIGNIVQIQKNFNSPEKVILEVETGQRGVIDQGQAEMSDFRGNLTSRVVDQQFMEKVRPFDLIRQKPQNLQEPRVQIDKVKLYKEKKSVDNKIFNVKNNQGGQRQNKGGYNFQRKVLDSQVTDMLFDDLGQYQQETLARFTPVIDANQNYNKILHHWKFVNGSLPIKSQYADLVKIKCE